jgi:hypothetical protein
VRKGRVRAGICVGFGRIAQDQLPAHQYYCFSYRSAHHCGGSAAEEGWTKAGGKTYVDLLARHPNAGGG